jgi:hypothetical protein
MSEPPLSTSKAVSPDELDLDPAVRAYLAKRGSVSLDGIPLWLVRGVQDEVGRIRIAIEVVQSRERSSLTAPGRAAVRSRRVRLRVGVRIA